MSPTEILGAGAKGVQQLVCDLHVRQQELELENEHLRRAQTDRANELELAVDRVKLLTQAMAQLGEGVLITSDDLDWPGPKILFVNEAMCRITGYSADELIGNTPRMLQGRGTDGDARERMRSDLAADRPCRVELVNYRKDGAPYDAELVITPLFDAAGRRTNFVAIHRDVTQRKQAERGIARLAAIVESSSDAIIGKRLDGVIESWNDAAEGIYGYTRDEAVGRPITILAPPDRLDEMTDILARIKRGVRVDHLETVRRCKDGRPIDVSLTVSPIKDDGGRIVGASAIARDISDVKQLQKQVLEIAAEESRRIGLELHDNLQQQLTGLGLLAQGLAEALAADSAKQAQMATRLADGLRESARDLHLLARGLVPVDVDVEGLRAALAVLAARVREQYGIQCDFHYSGTIDLADNFVATHLYRIAQEAVTNAVKHGRSGRIEISLTESEGNVALKVLDDGVGMNDKRQSGPGMGLRIMQYRAGMIGASLDIHPRRERGTQVTCTVVRNHSGSV